MTNLQLLSKIKGYTWVELAKLVEYEPGNLRNGIMGKIPLSERPLKRLHDVLGLNDKGFLRSDIVHVWKLVTTGKRLYNLDVFKKITTAPFPELVAQAFISQRLVCADKRVRQHITLLVGQIFTGEIVVEDSHIVSSMGDDFGEKGCYALPETDAVNIVVVQDLDTYVEITPQLIPCLQWLNDFRQPDSENPEGTGVWDQVVPRKSWDLFVKGKISPKELSNFREMPPAWSWEQLVFFASKLMSPSEAAKKLGISQDLKE